MSRRTGLLRFPHTLVSGDGLEPLLADLAAELNELPAARLDAGLGGALARVACLLDADRVTLAERQPDGTLRATHHWHAEQVRAEPTGLASADLPWLAGRVLAGEVVALDDTVTLPAEGRADRAACARLGHRSLVAGPLTVHHEVLGGLLVSAADEPRLWSQRDLARLRLASGILASALGRRQEALATRAAEEVAESLRTQLAAEGPAPDGASVGEGTPLEQMVGRSEALRSVLHKIGQVAPTDAVVLLLGETGTGKELAARAIHALSRRAKRPLVTVNCAALPATLIESELFGHERGAFTGAVQSRPGRFEMADGGTLFLDEIGELDPALQAKLLRVLQNGEVQRIGAAHSRRVDVRVVAATNRNLQEGIRAGHFRDDLYYRLSVFPVELPPLRARRGDIPLLVWYFVQMRQRALGRAIERIPVSAMAALSAYDWPGNVRELQNVIERALIQTTGPVLQIDPAVLHGEGVGVAVAPSDRLDDAERNQVLSVLVRCAWRIEGEAGAAARLGLAPSSLRHRMTRLGIRRPTTATP